MSTASQAVRPGNAQAAVWFCSPSPKEAILSPVQLAEQLQVQ